MVLQFFLGFLASFVATLPPGLLNLTSLKISLEKGVKKSHHFALGVSLIIFVQSYVSLALLKYMHNQTMVGVYMQIIGIIVFTFLSFYFFSSYIKGKKDIPKKPSRIQNSFYLGLIMSSINFLGIPYYCSIGSTLNAHGWLDFTQFSILFFVLGTAIGTFSLLSIYNYSAPAIEKKLGVISKNVNFILGTITAIVALITLIQIL